ncbi:hypothetical protein [Streptomyces hoynatensis]|uniref:Amino acid ABC transporter permease n=1 Tax=Streptomyces hoynatensis TaxID=1141874 RepID=A0A3A9ZC44_9ACTN|nr:hypothetical protein [Streptomyces hoynatensis]RKN45755.1 hypothetical protein D7294_04660 [Streptomyces hoynatensis]
MGNFDEEWARIQADARERVARTRLDSAGDGQGSGARPGLGADWGAKRAAADHLDRETLPGVASAGERPVDSLTQAASRLAGWETARGLHTVLERWQAQVSALRGQLEVESNALRSTASDFQGLDAELGHRMRALNPSITDPE